MTEWEQIIEALHNNRLIWYQEFNSLSDGIIIMHDIEKSNEPCKTNGCIIKKE